jgi:hypothetical protein
LQSCIASFEQVVLVLLPIMASGREVSKGACSVLLHSAIAVLLMLLVLPQQAVLTAHWPASVARLQQASGHD